MFPGRPAVRSATIPFLMAVWVSTILLLTPSLARSGSGWNDISDEELAMTSWPGDPEATAVVLEDVGEVEFIGEFDLVFKRYRRIKILTKGAYEKWGTVKIPYFAKSGSQKVDSIEGTTTNRESDGSQTQARIDSKSIFDEDVNRSVRQIRFTMPDLRPGSIIEYRYTMHSRGGSFLRSWEFGADQPTRSSEFVATIPDNLEYIMVKTGLTHFATEVKKKVGWPSRLSGYESAIKHGVGQTQYSWTMKDVPAIREEPFITTTMDYVPRLRFQLSHWSWPGAEGVDVIKDWETVARDFNDNMGSCPAAEGKVKGITSGKTDPREKMEAILKYVRRTMSWDRGGGGGSDICMAFKARKGSTEDIAKILTLMLRKSDLQAFPVLVSTRSNGKPITIYPLTTQFDRIMTLVVIEGREYLLDASDPLRPMDLLPMELLNEMGFVADPDDPRWVEIPAGKNRSETVVRATLSEHGVISGVLESSSTGYAALEARHKLGEESEQAFVNRVWSPKFHTGSLDSTRFAGKDSVDLPLVTTVYFSDVQTVNEGSHRIYFEPVLAKVVSENPFPNPRRILPVDLGFTLERAYTLTLDLPEAYALESVPKDINIILPHNGGHLKRKIEAVPGQIRFHRELRLDQPRYDGSDLKALRDCYDRLLAVDSEHIVLVKRAATADGTRP
ncbi:MAG: DUF3857 domain-containing protein [Candidatus Eisenbacteria bacterium]|nr:DUF3857 domain-containing protein [Candidatus Eisenbacteria bacterium]